MIDRGEAYMIMENMAAAKPQKSFLVLSCKARRKAKATVENKVNTNVRSPEILASLLGANDEHEHVYYLDSCTGAIDC